MNNILICIYIATILIINILQIKEIKKINNDILFDITSIDTLSVGLSILYYKYNSIGLSLLLIFIMIFINSLYIKDIKLKNQKALLTCFLIQNLFFFIYGTLKYIFI